MGATALRDFTWLMRSADAGLLIGVLGIGRVLGGDRVEDEPRRGVSFGTRTISLGVQFSMSSLRGVAASDEDANGLIDDRRRSQICSGVRPGWAAQGVWRAGGRWWIWQGAGWFLLVLMLVELTMTAPVALG
jgi:hypothetical protein